MRPAELHAAFGGAADMVDVRFEGLPPAVRPADSDMGARLGLQTLAVRCE